MEENIPVRPREALPVNLHAEDLVQPRAQVADMLPPTRPPVPQPGSGRRGRGRGRESGRAAGRGRGRSRAVAENAALVDNTSRDEEESNSITTRRRGRPPLRRNLTASGSFMPDDASIVGTVSAIDAFVPASNAVVPAALLLNLAERRRQHIQIIVNRPEPTEHELEERHQRVIMLQDNNLEINIPEPVNPCIVCCSEESDFQLDCCNHRYCENCILRIQETQSEGSCPLCRRHFVNYAAVNTTV